MTKKRVDARRLDSGLWTVDDGGWTAKDEQKAGLLDIILALGAKWNPLMHVPHGHEHEYGRVQGIGHVHTALTIIPSNTREQQGRVRIGGQSRSAVSRPHIHQTRLREWINSDESGRYSYDLRSVTLEHAYARTCWPNLNHGECLRAFAKGAHHQPSCSDRIQVYFSSSGRGSPV